MPELRALVATLVIILVLILANRILQLSRNLVARQLLNIRNCQRRRAILQIVAFRFRRLRVRRAQFPLRRRPVVWVYPRPQFWFEEMLNNAVNQTEWKKHFRVSRQTFEHICQLVAPQLSRQDTPLRRAISLEKRVAVSLWRLGTGSAFRATAITFGIGKATAVEICHEFSQVINSKRNEFIKFPSDANETKQCIRKFADTVDFPQALGAIDGTHIEIKAPLNNHADYFNRKQHYSIVAQAVVDADLLFMDVSTGWPGSIHDARVLRLSSLFRKAENGDILSEPIREINGCAVRPLLLGDPAYPTLSWLMAPYPTTAALTPAQRRFNRQLSKARVVVERAFGKLKGRWRCLLKQLEEHTGRVPETVLTCCILHNICVLRDDDIDDDHVDDDIDDENAPAAGGNTGRAVREAIMNYFVSN